MKLVLFHNEELYINELICVYNMPSLNCNIRESEFDKYI